MRISDWSSDVCSSDRQIETRALTGKFDVLRAHRHIEAILVAEREALAVDGDRAFHRRDVDDRQLAALEERVARGRGRLALRGQLDRRRTDRDAADQDRKSTRLNSSH